MMSLLATIVSLFVATPGDAADTEPAASAPVAPAPITPTLVPTAELPVIRVGGDMEAQVSRQGEVYTFGSGMINTPLPEGYPPPTPFGAIELKHYPLVRRAQVTKKGSVDWGMNGGFWPLFRHIQRRDIEMTSPVEFDYKGLTAEEGDRPEGWTMSFLYRRVEQGPVGPDETNENVEVVDIQPMTVVSIGFQGDYSFPRVRQQLKKVALWLEQHDAQWEQAGDPRSFYYNGPERRGRDRWGEVQIPIRLRIPVETPAPRPEIRASPDTQ